MPENTASSRQLPPLNSLRAFDATARLGSLARAAETLHISASAVSHQLRALEADLGVRLFERGPRGVTLTAEGQVLAQRTSEAFALLKQAAGLLRTQTRTASVRISMVSTFALTWFVPRLPAFYAAHPQIDIRVSTTTRVVDFDRDPVDCAIRFGRGRWPGCKSHLLYSEILQPICSPALLARQPILEAADLERQVLLSGKLNTEDWPRWFTSAGLARPRKVLTVFDTRSFVIQAARNGLGVAMLDPAMVAEDLARGTLVAPLPHRCAGAGRHWFVTPSHVPSPEVTALRDWLVAETAGLRRRKVSSTRTEGRQEVVRQSPTSSTR